MVEIGAPPLLHYVRSAQKKLISKLIAERETMLDNPFNLALGIAHEARCPTARYISTLESFDPEEEAAVLLTRVRQSTRTKFRTYADSMNPYLTLKYSGDVIPLFEQCIFMHESTVFEIDFISNRPTETFIASLLSQTVPPLIGTDTGTDTPRRASLRALSWPSVVLL